MKLVRLTTYNIIELTTKVSRFKQLLPFYSNQGKARSVFLNDLSDKSNQTVAIVSAEEILALISFEDRGTIFYVTNFLLKDGQLTNKKGLGFWLNWLEKTSKLADYKENQIELSLYDQSVINKLNDLGYEEVDGQSSFTILSKKLSYHTALILAGGGARGAYQIGVWKALRELGVEFDLICGTSVGALNGALIAQGEYDVAENMWSQIDTGKILSYPGLEKSANYTMQQSLKDVQNLVMSAANSQGVSTEPLREMIHDMLDEEKMHQQPKDLFLCTTQLPNFKETVISLKETAKGEFGQWLLASSSFFPAMEAAKINGGLYVDGGYRNNIPLDVALNNGATEGIIVNVKGPGMTKNTTVPDNFPLRTIESNWNLGTVLLFDGARSEFNIQLGYLETLKSYGKYIGHWYTLAHEITDSEVKEWQAKCREAMLESADLLNNVGDKEIKSLVSKIRNLYNDRMTEELSGLYLLEYVAKQLEVSPIKIYTLPKLVAEVKAKLDEGWNAEERDHESMLLSVNEWLQRFAEETTLPTEKQQIASLAELLKKDQAPGFFDALWPIAPRVYLAARLVNYLSEEGKDEKNESRI
ncbi:patatin-like phospholipase family protein [Vagococcus coleopterorum]|uniref:Patatin-like phospholipase family protein n=1 Tax=Vagococcus coleopterorum TaxID=2714946 RepID=A0A6G8AMH7_9ENTE|nr:patatin-like phospholipase family protein [Vagococcus coleopterorum]QIL46135.1 patatin-like phospholipase family protein [Vagococcus coleopterorum]